MLIYHFGSKERLVGEILGRAQQRLASVIEPPDDQVSGVDELITHLWTALKAPIASRITRLYVETCVLALQDPQRWKGAPERLRGPWRAPLHTGLVTFGVAPEEAGAPTDLVLDTLDGLALDRLTATDPDRVDAAAAAFATLLAQRAAAGR